MSQAAEGEIKPDLGVIETIKSDNVLRWDGQALYVEQDVYHNGQLVHRKYKRRVTRPVAEAIRTLLGNPD